jgi:hypothetical protein
MNKEIGARHKETAHGARRKAHGERHKAHGEGNSDPRSAYARGKRTLFNRKGG